ncbi:lactonase family protein [Paraliomyxa miuraensis]|uniref:lactonase family protein n=1 Tax=Paraliomyxa miuraensis TaxID=376150 RepID=UPI0022555E67|nr:lactonase family protein [Paraliomyxa miuraensis]MCX4241365.1 lactonase family protein [Paraliomyxa miuraensis]
MGNGRATWMWTTMAACCLGCSGCGDSSGDGDGSTGGTATTEITAPSTTQPDPTSSTSSGADSTSTTVDPDGTGTGDTDDTGEPEPPEGTFWVFVTANQGVSTWSMDPVTGALTLERELPIGADVGPLASDPQHRALYVGVTGAQRADAFAIDPVTADLTPLGQVGLGLNPVYLSTDRTGRHLLTSTFGGDELAIFPIERDGSLGGPETQRLDTPEEPHSIIVHASNQWVVVPHRTPDLIGQYALDEATGTVSAGAVPQASAPAGTGPRHLVFHPDGGHAYVSDEFSDSVSVYAFDASSGQLTHLATESTIPAGFDGSNNTCADVHITPDGRFVYVSNRGHDSLAMFAVDPVTGLLTSLGQVSTEPRPREFEVSPRGRYVFAAGQDSGMVASYAIDQETGVLTPGPVYDVGPTPLWVLAIELPPV